jgi:hypothetical protein
LHIARILIREHVRPAEDAGCNEQTLQICFHFLEAIFFVCSF